MVYLLGHAPREESDQPTDLQSQIRRFTGHIFNSQRYKVSWYGQWRLWSDSADAQADLSLSLEYMSEGTFSHMVAHIFSWKKLGKKIAYIQISSLELFLSSSLWYSLYMYEVYQCLETLWTPRPENHIYPKYCNTLIPFCTCAKIWTFILTLVMLNKLTLVLLNKLRCHTHFKFSANQITWSRLLLLIHIYTYTLEAIWSGSTLFAKTGYIWTQQDKG